MNRLTGRSSKATAAERETPGKLTPLVDRAGYGKALASYAGERETPFIRSAVRFTQPQRAIDSRAYVVCNICAPCIPLISSSRHKHIALPAPGPFRQIDFPGRLICELLQ